MNKAFCLPFIRTEIMLSPSSPAEPGPWRSVSSTEGRTALARLGAGPAGSLCKEQKRRFAMRTPRLMALAAVLCAGAAVPAFAAWDRIGSVDFSYRGNNDVQYGNFGGRVEALSLRAR